MANTTWSSSYIQGSLALSNGNLTVASSAYEGSVHSPDFRSTGKFYFEVTMEIFASSATAPGLAIVTGVYSNYTFVVNNSGTLFCNNANTGISLGALAANDVLCFAVDLDNSLVWARKNAAGNWNGSASANPLTGYLGVKYAGAFVSPFAQIGTTGDKVTLNSGDSAFVGTVPSGFTSGWTTTGEGPTALPTETALEITITSPSEASATETAIEIWTSTDTFGQQAFVSEVAFETWVTDSTTDEASVTEVALEVWATTGNVWSNPALLMEYFS